MLRQGYHTLRQYGKMCDWSPTSMSYVYSHVCTCRDQFRVRHHSVYPRVDFVWLQNINLCMWVHVKLYIKRHSTRLFFCPWRDFRCGLSFYMYILHDNRLFSRLYPLTLSANNLPRGRSTRHYGHPWSWTTFSHYGFDVERKERKKKC